MGLQHGEEEGGANASAIFRGTSCGPTGSALLAVEREVSKGSFKGDRDIDVEVDVDIDTHFAVASKSVQVLFNGIEAIMVLASIVLK